MNPSITVLSIILGALYGVSIFFALAETALLSVNRYRIRHLVRLNNRSAKRVQQLLDRPDRMFGVIQLCDTFADILASAIATILAIHFFGQGSVFYVTLALTFTLLILGKVAPKTLATIYPQQIAFFVAWPLLLLQRILYLLVWVANGVANGLLSLLGVSTKAYFFEHLNQDELRTLVHEGGSHISPDYQAMLIKVLDLEKASVEDIMVPRNDIVGIDITDDWAAILHKLEKNEHTRLPVYRETLDQTIGVLHLRTAANLLLQQNLNEKTLITILEECYFIPESTPLNKQLINFKREKKRMGLVVTEYGDIRGLVTLDDILEEIVGEFTTDISAMAAKTIYTQQDGSYLVDGSISVRELNRLLHCHLPTRGPKTLSGVIIEHLETIPRSKVALQIGNVTVEILEVKGNIIKTVRVVPIQEVKPLEDVKGEDDSKD